MRLQTRFLVTIDKKQESRRTGITITKDTVIMEAKDENHCVVMVDGTPVTILEPYAEIDEIIKNLIEKSR